ncbi:MAG: molybdopterin-dependent oxidoreductase [Peptococcaceae bacterium]|nr:molybdopterin-dependent oxidoreductase [Peptococcaceae bacterium]
MSKESLASKMSRRTFLKVSAATAAAVAAGDQLLGGSGVGVLEANAAPASEDGWYPGVCKMCMQGDCQQRVHVVDGVVVKVEGDPKGRQNFGALCPRGNSSIMQMYNPWRVQKPLKRTNSAKGLDVDPGFVEISWDEALQTVADRMKAVKDSDPRKLSIVSGFGVSSTLLGAFEQAFGTPNNTPSRGSACAYHIAGHITHQRGPDGVPDMDRCNYFIDVGHTLGPNIANASPGTRTVLDALERGCKIIDIDPRCSQEASKYTEWVPIRPGSELAFFLSMLHTMLYEIGELDIWYLKARTNGPYLIDPEGEFVKDGSGKPLMWNEAAGRAVPFDTPDYMDCALEGSYTVNGVECKPAFQLVKDQMKEYTPEWSEQHTTIKAATVRRIANEFVENAQIGATVEIDGFTFPLRPVGIVSERGPYQHTNEGPMQDFVTKIICQMVGAIEVPGGMSGCSMPHPDWLLADEEGIRIANYEAGADYFGYPWTWPPTHADLRQFYPVSHTLIWGLPKTILEPEKYHMGYRVEVLMSCGGGPVRSGFDREAFAKAWAAVPFHFVFALTYDENVMLADIVLPDCSFLEKDQFHGGSSAPPGHKVMTDSSRGLNVFLFRDASKITRPYNTRSVDEVLVDLAEKIGILYGETGLVAKANSSNRDFPLDVDKKPTIRDVSEARLKQTYGADKKLADITDESGPVYFYATRGAKNYNYYYQPDNQTRTPIYYISLLRNANRLKENLEAAGLSAVPGWEGDMEYFLEAFTPIPKWMTCPEFNPPPEYDMWAINWKTPMAPFFCGDTFGNVWLNETFKKFDPYEFAIWINTATAEKKGIKDGDKVCVESRYGKTEGIVKVTELIHPEVLGFPSGHGAASSKANPITAEGPYFNVLCNIDEKNRAVDPLTAGVESGPAVKIYKV